MYQENLTKEEFISKFCDYHNQAVEAMKSNNYRENNRLLKKRNKMINQCNKESFFKQALLELMANSNVGIQGAAATQSLKYRYHIEQSLKTLNKIMKMKNAGIYSLEAEMTLKMYYGEIPNRKL